MKYINKSKIKLKTDWYIFCLLRMIRRYQKVGKTKKPYSLTPHMSYIHVFTKSQFTSTITSQNPTFMHFLFDLIFLNVTNKDLCVISVLKTGTKNKKEKKHEKSWEILRNSISLICSAYYTSRLLRVFTLFWCPFFILIDHFKTKYIYKSILEVIESGIILF